MMEVFRRVMMKSKRSWELWLSATKGTCGKIHTVTWLSMHVGAKARASPQTFRSATGIGTSKMLSIAIGTH